MLSGPAGFCWSYKANKIIVLLYCTILCVYNIFSNCIMMMSYLFFTVSDVVFQDSASFVGACIQGMCRRRAVRVYRVYSCILLRGCVFFKMH